ncbi:MULTISPECIES: TenA family transcriptional regulator [Pseudoalteromonas]|uniref:Long-chain fatty acid--CoA ligase n=1 Tax=Pseudoalteromonas porphyrae TaxID=187330 RepID=A0A0N1MX42_9GAMM|nr:MULTISPECIES: iron-containing redox enzyme family protein [Pseudoalteromonas]KPH65572.1 long-chain fatty acid--CoA ligase [Pseudoalteromonas porphyrae]
MSHFFNTLQIATQNEREYLLSAPIITRVFNGQVSLTEYASFLAQAYHHVKHTVPLMMSLGAKLNDQQEWLREAVAEYIEEELGHQEWILNDIAACGFDKEAVRQSKPQFATELMVSYAYDSINRGNPLSFFGMVHVLEGTSIALADNAANKIRDAVGLPKNAFSYLTSHGALDIEHVKFFESLMNEITDEADQQAIIHGAKCFYKLYGNIFRALDTDPFFSQTLATSQSKACIA